MERQTLEQIGSALFLVWFVSLLPWLIIASLWGMILDGGPSLGANVSIGAVWTYPVSVGLAWKFRDKAPIIAFLPFTNIVVWLISGLAI